MSDFDATWRAAVRFRKVSRELEPLVRAVHDSIDDPGALKPALEKLLAFLAEPGRTDANCATTDYFFALTEQHWTNLAEPFRGILDDMSGTLHETVYAPKIASTFESLPEQLLARVRAITTSS
ncbi:MAG TPA: hypothetical protein VF111_02985 [Thermoanaerobaculia bacterium]